MACWMGRPGGGLEVACWMGRPGGGLEVACWMGRPGGGLEMACWMGRPGDGVLDGEAWKQVVLSSALSRTTSRTPESRGVAPRSARFLANFSVYFSEILCTCTTCWFAVAHAKFSPHKVIFKGDNPYWRDFIKFIS